MPPFETMAFELVQLPPLRTTAFELVQLSALSTTAIDLIQKPSFSTTAINSIPKVAVVVAGFCVIQMSAFVLPAIHSTLGNIFQPILILFIFFKYGVFSYKTRENFQWITMSKG